MTPPDRSFENLGSGLPAGLTPPDPRSPAGTIFGAARALFAELGFAGTSTRRIAESAGVNLAMIHYYFGTKERLYRRIVEMEFLDLHRIIGESLDGGATAADVVLRMPVFALRLHRDHPLLTRLLLREMADGAPNLPLILEELGEHGPVGLGGALRGMIEHSQEEGFAAGLQPQQLLAILFAVGNGLQAFAPLLRAVFGVDLDDPQTLTGMEEAVQTIFRRGLAPGNKE